MRFLTKSKDENFIIDLAQDLTGKTVSYRLADNGATVFQKSIGNGIEVLNEALGKIKLSILADDTESLVHRDFTEEVYIDGSLGTTDSVRFFPYGTTRAYLTTGATLSRPTLPTDRYIGYEYFDTDLDRQVVWNGSSWVDTSGDNETDIASLTTRVSQNETDLDDAITE